MFCPNCGKENENENSFCKYCGHDLKTLATPPPIQTPPTPITLTTTAAPQRTSYNAPPNPVHSNIDLGYLFIAILAFINMFLWLAWNFIFNSRIDQDTAVIYKLIRVASTILSMAQFLVMLIFAKKAVYKVLIAIIGVIVIIYELYYLIQFLANNKYY